MAQNRRRNKRRAKLQWRARQARTFFQAEEGLSPAQKALVYGARGAAALATGGASELARAGVKASPRGRRAAAAVLTGGASELGRRGRGGRIARGIATGGASELAQRGRGGRIARGIATGGASEVGRAVRRKKTPWWKRRRR